jgi:hypothetical protein
MRSCRGAGRNALQVLDTALLVTPSAWGSFDAARFDDGGTPRAATAVGIGAGVEGVVFGIVPFGLGVDLGDGLSTGSWRLGLRLGPSVPVARRF